MSKQLIGFALTLVLAACSSAETSPPPAANSNEIDAPTVSIVSSSVSKNPLVAGEVQRASVTLTSTTAMQDMIVDIRIYDSANTQRARKEFYPVTLPACTEVTLTYDFPSPSDLPPGQYNVQVGVWDTSWNTWLYETRDTFSVTRTAFTMNCRDDAWLTAGSYAVENNQWGRGPITDYSQCVGLGGLAADGSVSARWTWRWPAEPGEVKGYPAIVFGQKPGYPVTPNTNLPRQVNAISQLTSSWSTRSIYTGRGQLTFDLWLTRDANRYPSFPQTPITHEIMVAVEPYGGYGLDRNPAWFVEEITINGVRYRTYKADNFPPGASQQWRFLVFQMLTPMTQGTLEFKPLFDYLKSRGFITGAEYLSSLEFGTEPVEGTGEVTVDAFKATVR